MSPLNRRRMLLECKETAVKCILEMQWDVPMEMSILIAYDTSRLDAGLLINTGRNERRILLLPPPVPLTSCHAPQQYSWVKLVKLHLWRASAGMWFDLMSCAWVTRAGRGEERTQEIPLNYWEWLFGELWLVAVRYDMINCAEQELHFLISLLSIYLPDHPFTTDTHASACLLSPLLEGSLSNFKGSVSSKGALLKRHVWRLVMPVLLWFWVMLAAWLWDLLVS